MKKTVCLLVIVVGLSILSGCVNKEKAISRKIKILEEEAGLAIKTSNYTLAEEKFKAILALRPELEHVKNNLAILYAEFIGKPEEAIRLWEELLKINPHNAAYFNNLAGLYWRRQAYDKAIEYYREATKYHTSYHMPYFNMAQIYLELKDIENAEKMAGQGYQFAQQDARMQSVYSRTLLMNGKRAQGLAILRAANDQIPGVLLTNLNMARILLGGGDFVAAETIIDGILAEYPQNDLLIAELAEIKLAENAPSSEIDQLIQQLDASSIKLFESWYRKLVDARVMLKAGKSDDAKRMLLDLEGKIPAELIYFEGLRLAALAEATQVLDTGADVTEWIDRAFWMCPERIARPGGGVEELAADAQAAEALAAEAQE
ncbi:tetratricopeptide repeat protein [bacterium]|nr:tetratricopeptide repeat protein [candidate division CSSED10-310 bacterium]